MSNNQNHKPQNPESKEPKPIAKGAAAHHGVTDELYKEKASENKAIKIPEISLPKGGGAIKGIDEKFEVNPANGTASFSIPFPVTKARNDFEPQLSLSYNSGGGNGVFGMGWSMGLPSITRKTEKQLPKYFDEIDSDVFILSEAEDLVPLLVLNEFDEWVSAPEGSFIEPYSATLYTTRAFRPRIEGLFSCIEMCTSEDKSNVMWRTISKDNITTYYGVDKFSRLKNPTNGKIFSWLFSYSYNSKGDVIKAEYKGEDLANVLPHVFELNRNCVNTYLSKIYYGNSIPFYPDAVSPIEDLAIFPDNSNFMFSVVFDYGEFNDSGFGFSQDLDYNIPSDIFDSEFTGIGWICREDIFSNYRAGFDIRTYRRCKRIMQFHHFNHELGIVAYLVKSLELNYNESLDLVGIGDSAHGYSFLTSIIQKGHQLNPDDSDFYISECLPALNFTYQAHEWNNEVKTLAAEDTVHAPIGIGQNYQWTDLYSEGISGVLSEQGTGWFYKSNLGDGKFSNAKLVYPRPSSTGFGSGALSLQELEGNGVKYLVDYNGNNKGFYKLTPEEDWEPFRYFEGGLPNENFNNANAKFIDLNGDGLPDLMISEDSAFLWYESSGEKGFKEAYKINKPFDEDFGPAILFNDSTQSIQLADMSGDGLTDIVRIRNGEVCYWPNMGYGKFGNKIVMAYAPIFDHPDTYNPKYIRLADIDGSGTSDIIYLSNGKASVWLNDCGNAFNNKPFEINNLPQLNTATEVSIIDFLGTGTSCLVYSSSLPAHKEQPWKYIDFMGGKKPHLMTIYSNGLGKEVSFDYKSSSHFYLKDKAAGKPWATKLPFAVHVLTKVITRDTITKLRLVNEYTYHHGYYDYEEREFRGFGRVEQKDVEAITETNVIDTNTQLDQAPILIKSWYHTGAYIRNKKMLDHYAEEYYQNDDIEEHTLPGAIIEWAEYTTHNADDIRQAHRACKGMMLRQEVYALDIFNDPGNIPISTTKQNCYVKHLQPRGTSLHPVFIALESEKIAYQYEQIANDPRITHSILLKVNEFGQALLNASIAYPRIETESSITQGQQKAMRVIVTEQNFTSAVNDLISDPFHYQIPLAAESKTWEVRIDIAANTYYTKSDFDIFINNDLSEIAYHDSINSNESKRLIEHSYITYLDDTDNITELALFVPNKRAQVYQQYQLAFNDDLLTEIYDTYDSDVATLAESNGFIKDINNNYWLPSGRAILSDIPPVDFYLPKTFVDALGNETLVNYDTNYHLFIESIEDELENLTSITRFDFRVMAPQRMLDINENNTYFIYDILGRLSAMALGAKGEADDLTGYNSILSKSEREIFFDSPREEAINYLVHATASYVYDQHSIPAKVANIVRERHYFDVVENSLDDKTMCSFEYSNGFGQVVLKKVQAERGNVLIQYGSSTPTTLKPGIGQWLLLNNDPAPAPYDAMEPHRWVGTGRIVFNNKGNPVKQYEPYFSITHQFEDDLQIVQIGVSPEIFYDALGRNIKTVMPDGTFTKVVYHPWHQELWDAGDTVIDSAWYSTRQALGIVDPYHPDYIASEKSKAYANTPQLIYFDNLGRPVCNQEHIFNDPDDIDDVFVYTQLKLDIEGNLMNVIDGLDRECMAFKYNMLGQRLYQTHIDSGERWNMTNAMGKPLWQLNSKGTIFTFTYDVLNRPLDFIADDGVSSITYQKMQYGEGEINAHLLNLNGKLLDLRDGSGEQGFKEYDFKGNALYVSKGFVEVVGNLPDWSSAVDMASGGLNSITLYDALNRPITIDAGDKTTKYTYNEAGLPETVIVDDGSDNLIVENISYNAKGQREFIGFGNDTYSEYFYDEKTFRLKRIITQRDADTEPLQDINYVYDAVGNIVYVKDNAQQTFYFDNSIINPESFYTYDALYRLIEATGRENFNNTGFYEVTTPQGLGGNDVQNYERSFEYDVVGNITKMQHAASANSFTKHFHYDNDNNQLTRIFIGSSVSPLESYTYDEHGNMLASNDRQFTYNLLDQLQVVDITGGSWKALYMYNAEGQRDRKIILNSAGTKDRAYFQNYELYREFDNADDLVLERYTHHITDGEKKVATLDQETGSSTMYRYQYGNNLGSVGLELDDSAGIISYEEYYPFGGTAYYAHNSAIDVPRKRYKYCGKEQDEETGLYYYGARYYAPWLCRFASVDPKALEYVQQSSYVFADNNPVVKYDVNGEGTDEGKDLPDNKNNAGNNTAVASTTGTAAKPKNDPIITPEQKKKQEMQNAVKQAQKANAQQKLYGPNDYWNSSSTETIGQAAYRAHLTTIAETLNLLSGMSMDDNVSDSTATAFHLFYEWVKGTGGEASDKREFDENSTMGKQMLESPEILNAIKDAIFKAENGDYSRTEFARRLRNENFIGYATGFPIEAADNPARAFHGSFAGSVEVRVTQLKGGNLALLQLTVKFSDSMTALSGSRGPEIIGGYDQSNPTAFFPQENPYGPQGQFRTINIEYKMTVNKIIKIKPTYKPLTKDKL